jgi:hypothetical protein
VLQVERRARLNESYYRELKVRKPTLFSPHLVRVGDIHLLWLFQASLEDVNMKVARDRELRARLGGELLVALMVVAWSLRRLLICVAFACPDHHVAGGSSSSEDGSWAQRSTIDALGSRMTA